MSNPSRGYSITVRVTAPVGAGTTSTPAGAAASVVFDAVVAPAVAAAVREVAGKDGESDV
jgi:hypothetical protein